MVSQIGKNTGSPLLEILRVKTMLDRVEITRLCASFSGYKNIMPVSLFGIWHIYS